EAVSVETIDAIASQLESLHVGSVSFFTEGGARPANVDRELLLARVQGPAAIAAMLSGIIAVDTLHEALERRHTLRDGESVITRDGVWIGREWLRVSRDQDVHAGVIEREKEMRELREVVAAAEERLQALQAELAATRDRLREQEQRRDELQSEVNQLHRTHSELSAQIGALRTKAEQTAERLRRIETEIAEIDREHEALAESIAEARARLQEGLEAMEQFERTRAELEQRRDELRQDLAEKRSQAQRDRE